MSPKVGDTLPALTMVADPATMAAWAPILRDPNPIHLDPAAVRARGLGDRVINQGPINVAYLINALLAAFPGGTITALETRFLDNVFAGDTVTTRGTVVEAGERDGRLLARCALELVVEGRGPVLSGSATVARPIDR